MKKNKPLIISYICMLVLSLVSIYGYKKSGSEFFSGLSSIMTDLTLIAVSVSMIYTLIICSKNFKEMIDKKDKKFYKNTIISFLILLLTLTISFISFVNIFAHKNFIEYIVSIFVNNNHEIISLFIKSLIFYIFIYLCSINGITLNNLFSKDDNILSFPIAITLFFIGLLFIFFIFSSSYRLLYLFIFVDIILYILVKWLCDKYEKRK